MARADYQGQVIWLIGASSGIGAALAQELAARGATLALSARRESSLHELQQALGAGHRIYPLDVAQPQAVAQTAQAIARAQGGIDRVLFLAADYAPMTLSAIDLPAATRIVTVNLLGALHVMQAAVPLLRAQGRGQIALCGSVAGYIGLPAGQPYSATKAALINLAESLHAELPPPLSVKLISPGFVRTPLTDKNEFPMPMIITAPRAARYIADGLQARAFEIHFPKRFTLVLKLLRALPYPLALRLTRALGVREDVQSRPSHPSQ